MSSYYNEIDPFAAQWLRNLIDAGHIAPGIVDERSIEDIHPEELDEFTQCHFFAGIGGWSLALRLAGWPDDEPVWTGSCPCQPFSSAGKGAGFADERHLWPAFHHLITERRPPVVFGEQVAGGAGRSWLSLVRADLEALGYAVGAGDICAASLGAPHIRQRLYWVADAASAGRTEGWPESRDRQAPRGIEPCSLVHTSGERPGGGAQDGPRLTAEVPGPGCEAAEPLVNTKGKQMGVPGCSRIEGVSSPWSNCDWLPCRDGKARPVEPGTFPLASRIPGRVGRLRAYGNAIVPQVAQAFVEAYLQARVTA